MSKPELEFSSVDQTPWTTCAGAVPQLQERILALDPASGIATRILHIPPHTDTTPNGVQVHDFWEEVYILRGSFTDLRLGRSFSAGEYACRPPGMKHGPWRTGAEGCLTFEVRYQAARSTDVTQVQDDGYLHGAATPPIRGHHGDGGLGGAHSPRR